MTSVEVGWAGGQRLNWGVELGRTTKMQELLRLLKKRLPGNKNSQENKN